MSLKGVIHPDHGYPKFDLSEQLDSVQKAF